MYAGGISGKSNLDKCQENQIWINATEWREPNRSMSSGSRPEGEDLEGIRRTMLTIVECILENDREHAQGIADMSIMRENFMCLFQCAMLSACCRQRYEILQFIFEQMKVDADVALESLEDYAKNCRSCP